MLGKWTDRQRLRTKCRMVVELCITLMYCNLKRFKFTQQNNWFMYNILYLWQQMRWQITNNLQLTNLTRLRRGSCGLISEHSTIAPELIIGLWGLPERPWEREGGREGGREGMCVKGSDCGRREGRREGSRRECMREGRREEETKGAWYIEGHGGDSVDLYC